MSIHRNFRYVRPWLAAGLFLPVILPLLGLSAVSRAAGTALDTVIDCMHRVGGDR